MNRARNNNIRNLTNPGMNGGLNNMNGSVGGVTNGTTYGRNPNGGALAGSLADQIRALCFVKVELELYLDTHPRCRTALDYYYQTVEELKKLTEQYENTVGPLTAMGNISTDQWHWVDGPWPWQQAGDFKREGDR